MFFHAVFFDSMTLGCPSHVNLTRGKLNCFVRVPCLIFIQTKDFPPKNLFTSHNKRPIPRYFLVVSKPFLGCYLGSCASQAEVFKGSEVHETFCNLPLIARRQQWQSAFLSPQGIISTASTHENHKE